MRKLTLITAVAAMALAGTAAVAQPSGHGGDEREGGLTERVDGEYRAALLEATIVGIQVGLKLTDAQKKLWEPVEKAMRAQAAARTEAYKARKSFKEGAPKDFMERLEFGATRMNEGARHMTAMADAMKPFWASLDENQRNLLPVLMYQGEGLWKRGYGHHGNRKEHLEGRGHGRGGNRS